MEDSKCGITSFKCSVAAGVLFSVGWWWFIDGLIIANQGDHHFTFVTWIPGLLSTLGLIGVNMLNPADLREDGLGGDDEVTRAKVFFFISWLFIFGGLVAAVWICLSDYSQESTSSNYPGVAIIMQTVVITFASVVFWMRRSGQDDTFA
ncbi:Transmembrane protein 50-like protein [Diplonema papillatum]|nr:Transmembrane protein 50-like protein [Diplonema papillatum]